MPCFKNIGNAYENHKNRTTKKEQKKNVGFY